MTVVNKLGRAALAAAFLVGAAVAPSAASAVTITFGGTSATNGTASWGLNFGDSATFGGGVSTLGAFTHSFDFSIDYLSNASSTVTSILLGGDDIDFTSIDIDGSSYTGCNDGVFPCTSADSFKIDALALGLGAHTITVNGNRIGGSGAASYSGTLEVAAVPEPATWGMLILGFGLVGAGMRSRKRQVVLA